MRNDHETPVEKGQRLVENLERDDEACAAKPDEPCPGYPFDAGPSRGWRVTAGVVGPLRIIRSVGGCRHRTAQAYRVRQWHAPT